MFITFYLLIKSKIISINQFFNFNSFVNKFVSNKYIDIMFIRDFLNLSIVSIIIFNIVFSNKAIAFFLSVLSLNRSFF